jgi:hypothetical protein
VALNVLWIVLVIERFFIKKIRVKKYYLELVASFVALPFEFFVLNVLVDFITNFRPISFILQGITAGFIIISLLLLSLWSAFSLERWHAVKRKLSGEDDEIWVEDWVEEYEDEDEDGDGDENGDEDDEDEYVKEKDVKVIDYST